MQRRVSLTKKISKPNQFGKSVSPSKGDDGGSARHGSLQMDSPRRGAARHGSLQMDGFRRGSVESRRGSAFLKSRGRNSVSSGRKSSISTECSIQEDDQAKSPRRNTGIAELRSTPSSSPHRLSNAGKSPTRASFSLSVSPLPSDSETSMVVQEKAEAEQSQDGLSDVSEGSNGYMEWERERKLRQSGPAQLKLWVSKRSKAIKSADWCRCRNLKRLGRVAEFLPPTCSFRCSKADSKQSLADLKQGGASDTSKIKKAASMYGRPVWHEVYGKHVTLPPITPR